MVKQYFAVFLVSQALPPGLDGAEIEVEDALYYRFQPESAEAQAAAPDSVAFDFDEASGQFYPRQYVNYHVVMEIHNGVVVEDLSEKWDSLFRNQPELLVAAIDQLLPEEAEHETQVEQSGVEQSEAEPLASEFQELLNSRAAEVIQADEEGESPVSQWELLRVLAQIREQIAINDEAFCLGVFCIEEDSSEDAAE
jgi:hypothetical protein